MKPIFSGILTLILASNGRMQAPTNVQGNTSSKADLAAETTATYPRDQPGILLQAAEWVPLQQVMPANTKAKRGLAASFSYGAVPANAVAEYAGRHAQVQIAPGRPFICICRMISLPGTPLLVRLHPKKDTRELDGGRIPVIGAKTVEAKQSDIIPIDVSNPEQNTWLVRPREALPEGEYALMLGPQNIAIFPFGVSTPLKVPDTAKR